MSLLNVMKYMFFGLVMALGAFITSPVMAQGGGVSGAAEVQDVDDALLDPNLYMGIEEAYNRNLKLRQPEVQPQELSTMFFTLWQHRLLQEAKRRFRTRPPDPGASLDNKAPSQNKIRGIRELSLGGIVYTSTESWIVWLNGQRVTPDAIPKQILDIKVSEDYIELKWIDSFTNLVFPIRLQQHQRFNLDTRIFLPGVAPL